jgi:hypothetical protein
MREIWPDCGLSAPDGVESPVHRLFKPPSAFQAAALARFAGAAIERPHEIRRTFMRLSATPIRSTVALAAMVALAACSSNKERPRADLAAAQINTIGVNSYLWRAALETVSFAPLLQSDSNGGVIVTDWYANPRNPGERVKLTVSILDTDLRADALRVAASRQVSQGGSWVDAPVQAATVQKLEDIILTKARELRRQAVAG